MRELIVAGAAAGLVCGLLDAVSLGAANRASFAGAASLVRFLGGSAALYGLAAAAAGGAAGIVRALAGRPRPGTFAGLVAGASLFAWAGVRIHVRWFFGEPILHPAGLAAYLAAAAGAAGVAWALRRPIARLAGAASGRRGGRLTGAALFLACAAAVAPSGASRTVGGAERPPSGARDVLLVTLDTTRADHLSVYGYPRATTPWLDRYARAGSLDLLWAAVPLTNPSHCTLLTGLPPREHGVFNNGMPLPGGVPTVVRGLAAQGWHCGAFVSGIPLKSELSGLAPGFSTYDDIFSPVERIHPMLTSLALVRVADRMLPGDLLERRAPYTVDAAIRWLGETPSPRFLWVHLFDPHTPYRADSPLVHRFRLEDGEWPAAGGRPVTEWPVADYDAELRGTDRAVGRLLRAFTAVAPGGVACITADHGEGLLQHGELAHGSQLFEEDLRLPWITGESGSLAGPAGARLAGMAPPRPAADVAGMLAALARGEALPEEHDGPLSADTYPPEGRGRRTAVLGRLPDGTIGKTIRDHDREETVAYELTRDPGETRPGDASGTAWVALRGTAADVAPQAVLDPEVERRLRALGYVH